MAIRTVVPWNERLDGSLPIHALGSPLEALPVNGATAQQQLTDKKTPATHRRTSPDTVGREFVQRKLKDMLSPTTKTDPPQPATAARTTKRQATTTNIVPGNNNTVTPSVNISLNTTLSVLRDVQHRNSSRTTRTVIPSAAVADFHRGPILTSNAAGKGKLNLQKGGQNPLITVPVGSRAAMQPTMAARSTPLIARSKPPTQATEALGRFSFNPIPDSIDDYNIAKSTGRTAPAAKRAKVKGASLNWLSSKFIHGLSAGGGAIKEQAETFQDSNVIPVLDFSKALGFL